MMFDIQKVRADFPALEQKIYGNRLAYLDSAASAQKPKAVIESITLGLSANYANVHRGLHFLANEATEAYETARTTVKKFLNASQEDEIIFVKNATEAINLVAYSWGMKNLKSGDEILLSSLEHHANIVPWHFLRERLGVELKFVPLNSEGNFDLPEFEKAISKKTKLLAISHMSNVTGEILPIEAIIKKAKAYDLPVLVDGSQAVVHKQVDVQALGCDWYVFTGHKLYGPTGIGVLYGKKERLEDMPPFLGGGEMIAEVTTSSVSYNVPPFRFEAGTPPIIEAIGLTAAITYVESLGYDSIANYEKELSLYAKEALSAIKDLSFYGAVELKHGIFSFNLKNIHPHDLATYLDRKGVAIRAGTHCAQPLLSIFGITACARASLALYSNKADIDQLITALDQAKRFFDGK
ncbi:MAG: cysteine desulfurase [Alphaproteobacteria bacterium]|nr:cysteine desulfurase [Alphaproteobacteria bacterium]